MRTLFLLNIQICAAVKLGPKKLLLSKANQGGRNASRCTTILLMLSLEPEFLIRDLLDRTHYHLIGGIFLSVSCDI